MLTSYIQAWVVLTAVLISTAVDAEPMIKQGPYEVYDNRALQVLNLDAPIETLATGFEWLEGPVWVEDEGYLLFSDIPTHQVYRYQPDQGVHLYLADSGYSNGLVMNNQNELVLLQSRSRKIVTMASSVNDPKTNYRELVSRYQGQQLNSPNDGIYDQQGTLFFSDPPYGLAKQLDDPAKELSFQGVYSLNAKGQLRVLDKQLIYPNGIALSKDESTLYVAASNPQKPAWYQYKLHKDGTVINKKLLYQLPAVTSDSHGLPDGLKIHADSGIIFATGPNGLWLFDEQGTLLARVRLPHISANLAFNAQQNRVYITAHQHLLALSLKN
ncbi:MULTISPECIES: SMP-30/gluconolactonase/LRE family protein [unclassified Pseudoalteromonas]|uniref:SMP-30/gluconolactonase/LRE family protein n=1 Tax=unclassified Pseudoalteromonas TaxID=194690 RepID=UPI000B3CA91A|nr:MULTISPECIES: SMP-30/gluconolactonase/LRE family protein [unclassified Pseudoalteromonas]MDN3377834.1 SMP-30/gluconolactonase/LRE family protein [Pseudoalteromonas sp. APC 3893]MDN3386030.1 SMP-30/gluconolactonase/LRE family protein [Pseudoalteromonas sp. APC 4017]OUS69249.1 gluconolactonase [Pseudoalteromonas sp. A601]